MPNVSASLSDEAYEIWRSHEGKRSPWVSKLIVEGALILARNGALDLRIGSLQAIISDLLLDLLIDRQGEKDNPLSPEQVLLWNRAVESLSDSIHYYHHQIQERS